jgi:SNF2 family DNA or RNA helicase
MGSEMHLKKSQFGNLESLWKYAKTSPSLNHLKDKWQNFQRIQEAPPSSSFKGTLRPYQQQGVNWLAFLHEYGFHGILADEMGLGKTVQVLAFLSRLPHQGPHLIIMPTSLLFNWRKEINQFLPLHTCYVHHGSQRKKTLEELQKTDIILTSYSTLRLDLPLLQSLAYSCLILDEAQMIKNSSTQTAQATCQLNAQLRLCLTGTPIENHLQELWSHFHFLMPDLFGSKEQFDADIQAAQSDHRYLERIKRKMTPFLLRRRKQEVASDLPPRLDQVVWIEMSEEQRSLYDQLLAGFKSGLLKKVEAEGMGQHRLEVLEAILRLRQVCCHPLLVSSLLEQTIASAKFDALMQDLETIIEEKRKVLVYSQFTSMLHLMTKAAKERGWTYGYLDGSTKNREEVVTRFQEDPHQFLFFISLKAGGVGLNLIAADYVYLYDPWWNEAVEEQAIDRAHRIGQQNQVIAKRFVVAESIEEKMMKLKAAKRLMMSDLLEIEAVPAQLTFEDLRFLLD